MENRELDRSESPTKDIPVFKGFGSARNSATSSAALPAPEPAPQPSPTATSLARSGTLSWQRRPASRGNSRPASVVEPSKSSHVRNASIDEKEPSRDQIAASLSSRDPSWFKQTADRGTGSAAYRKNQVEDTPTRVDTPPTRRGLPGLSRELPTPPVRQASPSFREPLNISRDAPAQRITPTYSEPRKFDTMSRPASLRDSGISDTRSPTTSSAPVIAKPDLKSLIAADELQNEAAPKFEADIASAGESFGMGRSLVMSTSQARLTNPPADRPSSPTKGMGGFVQSAMLKRSDSVNKRWSAQPGASLSRQNSLASVRSGYGGLQGSHSMPRLEPTSDNKESSHEASSRPSSSSSNLTAMTLRDEPPAGGEIFAKPALPYHSRSKSVASAYTVNTPDDNATSPPASPSKRFSPTKSSWIESALTKPESPRPTSSINAQPSWMENLAKAKAQRGSAESTPRTGTPLPAEETVRQRSWLRRPLGKAFSSGLTRGILHRSREL